MLGPLWLDPLIRATWGNYNPLVLSQLDLVAYEDCYKPKIYRVPDPQNEVLAPGGYVEFGLEVTPGDLLYGFLLPCDPVTGLPLQFVFQLEDLVSKEGSEDFRSAVLASCERSERHGASTEHVLTLVLFPITFGGMKVF